MVANSGDLPTIWDLAEFRVHQPVGEQVGDVLRQPGVAAFHLGPHGVEIDEPGPKQRPRHRLQRRVHPTVQLDLVVQRAEDVRDGALFGESSPQDIKRDQITPAYA